MDNCIRILHLEDDALDAELVQTTLKSAEMACQITRVQSRVEFTQALQQGGYDVILADYHLPAYDGMLALRLAQERSPETPFIFVSGMLGEDAAINGLTQGATDYVLKQKLSRLAPAVKRALGEAENRKERQRAEAALRESEARYRRITEAITDYIYTVRVEGGNAMETRHGPGCLAVTGYPSEAFAAEPYLWIRMVVEADRPVVQEQARRILAGEAASAIEHRIVRKDGALRWVRNTAVMRHDAQGALRSYDGLIQDITERKQAEEALRESEALYRATVSNISDAVFITDDTGAFTFICPNVQLIFDYGYHEVETLANIAQLLGVGLFERATLDAAGEIQNIEREITTRFGQQRMLLVNVKRVSIKNGTVLYTCHDITERKRAEQERERLFSQVEQERARATAQAAELDTIFSSMSDGVNLYTPDGKIVRSNKAAERVFDLTRTPLTLPLDQQTEQFKPKWEDGQPITNLDDTPVVRALHGETVNNVVLGIYSAQTGQYIWLAINAAPVYDADGRLLCAVLTFRDITERKRAGALLQASETRYRSLFEDSPISLWEEDFTAIKSYLDNLRDSGISDFRAYFEQHPEAVHKCTAMVKIVDVNRVTLVMLECQNKEALFANLTRVFGKDSYDVFREELVSLAEGKQIFEAEVLHQTLRGSDLYVALKLTIIPGYEDTWSKVLVSLTDITKRKRAEKELRHYREHLEALVSERTAALEQEIIERMYVEEELQHAKDVAEAANQAKSVFLANMSHELRTPLNAILGFTQLLWRDPQTPPAQQEYLDIILRSGEYLLRLINDVLEIARIEAGRIELHPEACEVGILIRDVVNMMRNRAEAKHLQLTLEHSSDVPQYIHTDAPKLRQVLVNLLGNAIKFTNEGGVTLRVGANLCVRPENGQGQTQRSAPTTILYFEIEDTGIGIAAEDQARIFKPFEQVGTDSDLKGTGLGLAITRQYLELMGGVIRVESPPRAPQMRGEKKRGPGSIFRFEIPAHPLSVEASTRAQPAPGAVIALEPGQPAYRILIVEDQFEIRVLLRRILEPVGFEVREAANGAEAIQIFQDWQPHVIFMDWRMPRMDGLEAIQRIKAQESRRKVVIIMLTASAFKEQRDEALAAGADDFLSKPFQEEEISQTLWKHLGVRYVYAGGDAQAVQDLRTQRPGETQGLAIRLIRLPSELLSTLEHAASEGNVRMVDLAIEAIRPCDAAAAAALATLAKDFHYEEIWTMLQMIKEKDHACTTIR